MPKRDPLKDELTALFALRDGPRTAEGRALIQRALGGKHNFAVAAAADLIRDSDTDLVPLLSAAFERLMERPLQTDKGCTGKIAIARALERIDYHRPDVFLRGLHHVQPEPVWGGTQDTAVELRGICAMGLARLDHPGVL